MALFAVAIAASQSERLVISRPAAHVAPFVVRTVDGNVGDEGGYGDHGDGGDGGDGGEIGGSGVTGGGGGILGGYFLAHIFLVR